MMDMDRGLQAVFGKEKRFGQLERPLRPIFLVVLGLAVVLSFLPSVVGHPPSNLKLAYDLDTGMLTATFTHTVADPSSHYLYQIIVTKNGDTIISREYTSQPGSTFTYTYEVEAAEGDVLGVSANCNRGGSIAGELTVVSDGGEPGPGDGDDDRVPVPLWAVHASLMLATFILSLATTLSLYQKSHRWWFRAHKVLGYATALAALLGLTVAVYMVSESGGGHLRVPHAYLGVLTLVMVLTSPILGQVFLKVRGGKRTVRSVHLWIGRINLALILVTILAGLRAAGVL
jgi:hypothetical protein